MVCPKTKTVPLRWPALSVSLFNHPLLASSGGHDPENPADQVPAAFGKIKTSSWSVGIISAELYNRFSSVELPKALSFFSGRRLVPILTSF
jgi:phosphotransferase system  glucose/maltose/N-acetylglucosamine-specific IIC component